MITYGSPWKEGAPQPELFWLDIWGAPGLCPSPCQTLTISRVAPGSQMTWPAMESYGNAVGDLCDLPELQQQEPDSQTAEAREVSIA